MTGPLEVYLRSVFVIHSVIVGDFKTEGLRGSLEFQENSVESSSSKEARWFVSQVVLGTE